MDQATRNYRFKKFCELFPNNRAFAKAMGFKDGSSISRYLSGERDVSEMRLSHARNTALLHYPSKYDALMRKWAGE